MFYIYIYIQTSTVTGGVDKLHWLTVTSQCMSTNETRLILNILYTVVSLLHLNLARDVLITLAIIICHFTGYVLYLTLHIVP